MKGLLVEFTRTTGGRLWIASEDIESVEDYSSAGTEIITRSGRHHFVVGTPREVLDHVQRQISKAKRR